MLSKFDFCSFPVTGDNIGFQTGHLGNFEQFKFDSHFSDYQQIKIDPICLFLLTLGRTKLFNAAKNNSNPLCLTKKFKLCIGSDTSHF